LKSHETLQEMAPGWRTLKRRENERSRTIAQPKLTRQ
jgi:hypothetical protein